MELRTTIVPKPCCTIEQYSKSLCHMSISWGDLNKYLFTTDREVTTSQSHNTDMVILLPQVLAPPLQEWSEQRVTGQQEELHLEVVMVQQEHKDFGNRKAVTESLVASGGKRSIPYLMSCRSLEQQVSEAADVCRDESGLQQK